VSSHGVLLLLPIALGTARNMVPATALPEERLVTEAEQVVTRAPDAGPRHSVVNLGVIDTVGGTTCDWQSNGPMYRFLVNSPEHGLHVAWMYSSYTGGTSYPDRNMGYNFYDYDTREWAWKDSDFMQSGLRVFAERCGFGSLDADPNTGVAVVSSHAGSTRLRVEVGRDMAPGAGIFEYCSGQPTMEGYLWPPISLDSAARVHCACIEDAGDRDVLYYGRMPTWCSWDDPSRAAPPQPEPLFPDHNIAASKVSGKVCVTWVYAPEGYYQCPGFYRISTDGGVNWGPSTQLDWPPAYSGDTLPSFRITSLFPFYGRNDELHIAADVSPFVRDTLFVAPSEIWHWRADTWSKIHRADPESLLAPVGYNATVACRPSIGEDSDGNLYVAWEEFDGVNVEPGPPERLRADIWTAASMDRGRSWTAQRLTGPGGTVSNRFPSVVDLATEGGRHDTVSVRYLIDQVAGSSGHGEGPVTCNPIVVHTPFFAGQQEERPRARVRPRLVTLVRGVLRLQVGFGDDAAGLLLDVTGRKVAALEQGDNDVSHLAPGVYFVSRSTADSRQLTAGHKIVIQR